MIYFFKPIIVEYQVWFHYSWKLQAKRDRIALYKDRKLSSNLGSQHFRLLYGGEKLCGKSETIFRTLVIMIRKITRYLGAMQLFSDEMLCDLEFLKQTGDLSMGKSIWAIDGSWSS